MSWKDEDLPLAKEALTRWVRDLIETSGQRPKTPLTDINELTSMTVQNLREWLGFHKHAGSKLVDRIVRVSAFWEPDTRKNALLRTSLGLEP